MEGSGLLQKVGLGKGIAVWGNVVTSAEKLQERVQNNLEKNLVSGHFSIISLTHATLSSPKFCMTHVSACYNWCVLIGIFLHINTLIFLVNGPYIPKPRVRVQCKIIFHSRCVLITTTILSEG